MNSVTRSTLIAGIVLFIYGYLCRMLNLFFFWDAKTIGGFLLFLSLLLYLFDVRKKRREQGRKLGWVTVGISLLAFGLVLTPLVVVILTNTEAYRAAKNYVKSNTEITAQIGEVKSFGIMPGGSVQTTTINGIESGNAIFEMTVNGSKRNIDLTINLEKTPSTSWSVTAVR